MKKTLLLLAFACWTAGTAEAQTVVNVQLATTSVANHDNPTPKDFSIDQNGLNETYLWSAEINRLQGININLQPSDESVIYMQQNNGRLAFHFTNNFISHVSVKWDGGSC